MAGLKEAGPDKAASLNWTETFLFLIVSPPLPDKAASLNWTETFLFFFDRIVMPDKAAG